MIHRITSGVLAAAAGLLCVGGIAASTSAQSNFQIGTQQVATGLTRPLFVTAPVGDFNRLFIVEQRSGTVGRLKVLNLNTGTVGATVYLSVSPVSTGSEQGLLGLAFHPNFLQNGYFYVYYTAAAQAGVSAGSSTIVRYQANAPFATSATANAASATVLLTIPQPDANHNGGWMSFGPDGYLYIGTGDGGNANDVNAGTSTGPLHTACTGNAQDITDNLLGKMLRIDVDGLDNIPGNADDADTVSGKAYRIPSDNPLVGVTGDDEIFAYGLRNPWRSSFDRATGDLYIGDVGQGVREEVNVLRYGTKGQNFGWRWREGTRNTGFSTCLTTPLPTMTDPVLEYGHSTLVGPTQLLGCSITGGVVYRGPSMPCLQGTYFFTDYCSPEIHTMRWSPTAGVTDVVDRTVQMTPPVGTSIDNVVSFGEDARGEIYIVDQTGGDIFKVIPGAGSTGPDCDQNGSPDPCGKLDFNNDGNVEPEDVDAYFSVLGEGPCIGGPSCDSLDFNQDGNIEPEDVDAYFSVLGEGPCINN